MSEGAKGVETFHTQAGKTRDMAVGKGGTHRQLGAPVSPITA
jgi:hypothetical protein